MSKALIQASGDLGGDMPERHQGLTVLTTAVFAVGEMAGTGVLALPAALIGTGSIGIVLNVMCAIVSAFTGVLLGKSWLMVIHRYEEYQDQVRNPYPIIGQIAMGTPGRLLVSFSINFTLFGVGTVFLLIASGNIETLVSNAGKDISFCYWLVIVAGVLCPVAWLGTPKDFWPIAVGAVVATSIACTLILGNIIKDKVDEPEPPFLPSINFLDFFTAFGIICFAYGGHPAFPTFQADMRNPEKFGVAISLAYLIVLLMYLPVAVAGYYAYGGDAGTNILTSVSSGPLLTIVTILITLHLFCGFIIVVNPVCQECEELLRIPKEFTWKRVVFRTLFMGLVLFVAESIPHFGAILSLVGGSTTTILAYILPPIFYLRLCYMEGDWDPIEVPLHIKVACIEIISIGVVAGISSTYSAVVALTDSAFSTPCYVNITAAK